MILMATNNPCFFVYKLFYFYTVAYFLDDKYGKEKTDQKSCDNKPDIIKEYRYLPKDKVGIKVMASNRQQSEQNE
ncbi:hypothetical protein SOASR032_27570 [Pragia fontium]|uniref:Uncharacterized protein n=1 Tax=Pragia fontium TaxID=82985 RepID=A0ABQ5LKN7_9GAMM|nr:hypothetical protein SOASR032_27570 [Pragia fontium]